MTMSAYWIACLVYVAVTALLLRLWVEMLAARSRRLRRLAALPVLWAASGVVLIQAHWWLSGIEKVEYQATRTLPKNHVVMDKDLKSNVPTELESRLPALATFRFKYLRELRAEGAFVSSHDVAASPDIAVPDQQAVWTAAIDFKEPPFYLDGSS